MDDIPPPLEIAKSVSALLTEELEGGHSEEVVLPRAYAVLCLGLLNAVVEVWEGSGGLLH